MEQFAADNLHLEVARYAGSALSGLKQTYGHSALNGRRGGDAGSALSGLKQTYGHSALGRGDVTLGVPSPV